MCISWTNKGLIVSTCTVQLRRYRRVCLPITSRKRNSRMPIGNAKKRWIFISIKWVTRALKIGALLYRLAVLLLLRKVRVSHCKNLQCRMLSVFSRARLPYHDILQHSTPVFLNSRAAARYRALASIIPGRERFSWNLSF